MAFTPDYVCTNPSCKSYGSAHPHCKCGAQETSYAQGGAVKYFCDGNRVHRSNCEHFADGGEAQENLEFQNNPDLAVDHSVLNNGLLNTLTKSGHTKSEDPGRSSSEFLDHTRKGKKAITHHSQSMIEPKSQKIENEKGKADSLETKLNEFQSNPDLALQIGGNLGDHFPAHHAAVAAKAATAMTYLSSIKPHAEPGEPLDRTLQPSKINERSYRRQLALAENPKLIFQHAKEGTLVPQDFLTLRTLYPKLSDKIQDKAFETLTDAKTKGQSLTYAQKRKLSALIGQPLTFQQTTQACQAIMRANAPAQMPQGPQRGSKKASSVELNQLNKVNELSETPLQSLQAKRNK